MIDPVADSMQAESWFSALSKDGKKVFGIFNAAASGKVADKIVVIAHGLTGSPQDAMHQSARKYFNERGYDVARIAFYNSDPDGRLLRDCTLQLHADDLNAVVDRFSGQYKKLFVAGHSYGGLSTLFANPDATAISFWARRTGTVCATGVIVSVVMLYLVSPWLPAFRQVHGA